MNDRPAATRVRFLVLGWLCLLATLAYISRSCIAVPAERIQTDLDLTRDQMSQVMSIFYLAYAIFQLPGGWLGDRWGSRVVLTLIVLLWSAATGWMGFAAGFAGLYIGWALNGAAQAAIFPCCVNTVSRWFPADSRAFPNGMLGSFMSVGGAIGTSLTGFLLWHYGGDWRLVVQLLALPGFVCGVVFFLWFRNRPQEHPWVNDAERELIAGNAPPAQDAKEPRPRTPWLTMFTSVPMLLVCAQQFCRAAGYIFFLTWFPTFLQATRRVSEDQAGYYTSVPLLGVVVGSAFGGALMDWLAKVTGNRARSRQLIAVFSLLACGCLIIMAYFVSDPLVTVALLAAGSLGSGMCGPAGYTVTIDMGGRHIGTVFSVMNTAGNIGAFVMPMLVARFVDWRGWHEVLFLMAGLYFTAALCWSLVRVRGSIFTHE
jgi:MFS family permease